MSTRQRPDVICFSHLRWNFVYQRPQHLLTRCAQRRRVFYVEEPTFGDGPRLEEFSDERHGVRVAVPHLPAGIDEVRGSAAQRELLSELMKRHAIDDYALWYYTPLALRFSRHLVPAATVYDCMDELSAFAGAHPGLRECERELLRRADVVLTGGRSLYEAKRKLHPDVHAVPSGVDLEHFARARRAPPVEPDDQAGIPRPRLGFFGVIDERMDLDLVASAAALRPSWHIVLIGPVVKIDPKVLPRAPNIHYLGQKQYEDLPGYLAGWDVALLPFARNESTRFISPTKTPEYLAGGKPVVSTSIRDVVQPYAELGFARIADTPGQLVDAVEACLRGDGAPARAHVDDFLAGCSWDSTWARIERLLGGAVERRSKKERRA